MSGFPGVHFAGCDAHTQEAIAVQRVIERLTRKPHPQLNPDTRVGDLLGPDVRARAADSLDFIELAMALEEEYGRTATVETGNLAGAAVLQALLGEAIRHSTWSGDTIWQRSVRGVINERVRWRGDCTCATAARDGLSRSP